MAQRVVTHSMLKMMNNTETVEDTHPKSRDHSPHARLNSPVVRRHARTPSPDASRLQRSPIRSHPPYTRYHWSAEDDHEERPYRPIRGSSQHHDYGDAPGHLYAADRE